MMALASHPPDPSTVKLAPRRLHPTDTSRVLPRCLRTALDEMARCAAVVMQIDTDMDHCWSRREERRLRKLREEALDAYELAHTHATEMKKKDPRAQLNRNFKLLSYATTEHY